MTDLIELLEALDSALASLDEKLQDIQTLGARVIVYDLRAQLACRKWIRDNLAPATRPSELLYRRACEDACLPYYVSEHLYRSELALAGYRFSKKGMPYCKLRKDKANGD